MDSPPPNAAILDERADLRTGPAIMRAALRFVILVGVLSFFADLTYEGARGIVGPYLATLGAGAAAIGFVTGFGELLGYGLRLVSGRMADLTGRFWPITIVGYLIQMSAVPLLAIAPSWEAAALLVLLERVGKAVRNPPRDVMLSHAARQIGYGWAFGLHEALDQFGATLGPLLVAVVLAWHGSDRLALAMLAIPALICLGLVFLARQLYPQPEDMEPRTPSGDTRDLPGVFWVYLVGAGLVAAGFADYPLIAFHFSQAASVPLYLIPVVYATAMLVSGSSSLVFGRLYDRFGFSILIVLTIVTAFFAPMVFLGGFWVALLGAALWGAGMGVHESIIPAVVGPMVAMERRASAYGIFTAGYGVAWFLGSAAIGILYGLSVPVTIGFCMALELLAVPLFLVVWGRGRPPRHAVR